MDCIHTLSVDGVGVRHLHTGRHLPTDQPDPARARTLPSTTFFDIESPTPDPDTLFELYPALCVKFYNYAKHVAEPAGPGAIHSLFHAPCDHCHDADFECLVQLCEFRRHLRFRHLLLCSPRLFPDLFRSFDPMDSFPIELSIQLFNEEPDDCDLCKFWIACRTDTERNHTIRWKRAKNEQHSLSLSTSPLGSFWLCSRSARSVRSSSTYLGAVETRECVRPYIDWHWS
jgi:hypothetical protein